MATSEEPTTVIPADSVLGPKQGKWTYKHYAALPYDGRRYEIIDGILYIMPPALPAHQSVVIRLAHYLFAPIELAQRGRLFMYPLANIGLTLVMALENIGLLIRRDTLLSC